MRQGGQLLHHREVSFQGGQPPKQVMEVFRRRQRL